MDSVEKRQKQFFVKCAQDKKWKQSDREEEFNRIRKEYHKVIEEAGEKVNLAEDAYSLVDKYMRKLDQELLKFKLELEADNRGKGARVDQYQNSYPIPILQQSFLTIPIPILGEAS